MLKQFIILIITVQIVTCGHESAKLCKRAANACHLAPEATEGPYFWNTTVRQDITEGRPGIPFRLSITVLDTRSCSPIRDAVVDLWHCDSAGIYSHFIRASQGQMGGTTDNSTFFRGQQVTDSKGIANFNTIYPGWYPGRTTHLHVKVHIGARLTNMGGAIHATGGHVSHTGQLYFNDTLTDAVAKVSPYSAHNIQRVRNNEDGIYRGSGGATTIIPVKFRNDFSERMTGEITVGVDPTATPAPTGFGGGRPPGPPPTGPRPSRQPRSASHSPHSRSPHSHSSRSRSPHSRSPYSRSSRSSTASP